MPLPNYLAEALARTADSKPIVRTPHAAFESLIQRRITERVTSTVEEIKALLPSPDAMMVASVRQEVVRAFSQAILHARQADHPYLFVGDFFFADKAAEQLKSHQDHPFGFMEHDRRFGDSSAQRARLAKLATRRADVAVQGMIGELDDVFAFCRKSEQMQKSLETTLEDLLRVRQSLDAQAPEISADSKRRLHDSLRSMIREAADNYACSNGVATTGTPSTSAYLRAEQTFKDQQLSRMFGQLAEKTFTSFPARENYAALRR